MKIAPLVSIILPTYNVDKYLDRCLESLVNQTYKNIEIIIVIDGSTDNSFEIAKNWVEKDNRIKVIYQDNSGSGPARNNGIANSHGKYIIFVDPDDWVDENMTEKLLSVGNKYGVDLVITEGVTELYKNTSHIKTIIPKEKLKNELILGEESIRNRYVELFLKNLLSGPAQKLYKREIIEKYNIKFPDLRRSQDIVFNYRYYNYISSVYLSDDIFYHYYLEENGNLHKLKADYYMTTILLYSDIKMLLKEWEVEINHNELDALNNWFITLIGYSLEANIQNKCSIDAILKNKDIQHIVRIANPQNMYLQILKFGILHQKVIVIVVIKLKAISKKLRLVDLYKKIVKNNK